MQFSMTKLSSSAELLRDCGGSQRSHHAFRIARLRPRVEGGMIFMAHRADELPQLSKLLDLLCRNHFVS